MLSDANCGCQVRSIGQTGLTSSTNCDSACPLLAMRWLWLVPGITASAARRPAQARSSARLHPGLRAKTPGHYGPLSTGSATVDHAGALKNRLKPAAIPISVSHQRVLTGADGQHVESCAGHAKGSQTLILVLR